MINLFKMLSSALMALAVSTASASEDWPTKPIRLIVPYSASSGPDAAVRPVAESLSRILGKRVVVENPASAGGILGTQMVARAQPDGYTFGFGNNITLAVNKTFFEKLSYDPDKDFVPVGLLFDNAYLLVARPDFPANTVQELIDLAKASPGKINFASGTGIGSGSHLIGELLKSRAKIDITHVPYKAGAQAVSDLVSGRVDIMFDNVSGMQQFIANGTIKAIAVTSPKRLPLLPNVPTMSELGFSNFEVMAWGGIVAPAGTPNHVIERLNAAITKSMESPEVVRSNTTMALTPLTSSPQDFSKFIESENVKWAEMVRISGAKKKE